MLALTLAWVYNTSNMRRAVRAIVIKDGHLMVMHRNKFGLEYYTLIGGGIDMGESPEQALARELREETGVKIANPRLVIIEDAGDVFGMQYVYLCDYVSGEPHLAIDSEEAKISELGQNLYVPMWLDIRMLPTLPFRSEELKQALLGAFDKGFTPEPLHIQSD